MMSLNPQKSGKRKQIPLTNIFTVAKSETEQKQTMYEWSRRNKRNCIIIYVRLKKGESSI
jgi:hypothetical protein